MEKVWSFIVNSRLSSLAICHDTGDFHFALGSLLLTLLRRASVQREQASHQRCRKMSTNLSILRFLGCRHAVAAPPSLRRMQSNERADGAVPRDELSRHVSLRD
jgi:hypothetical protein